MDIATNQISIYQNWAELYAYWVPIVNQNGGPVLGPYTGGGIISVNTSNYNSPVYSPSYFILGQFSRFISPGAVSIGSDPGSSSTVTDVAFKKPDGEIVVIVANATSSTQPFDLLIAGGQISASLPTNTVGTYTWTESGVEPGVQYQVVNSTSSLCMSDNGSGSNGAQILQNVCSLGHSDQNWSFVSEGSNLYELVNQSSGLCLDDTNGSTSNGTYMQQWSCYGGSNQLWSLVSNGSGTYQIVNHTSGLCLDDTNGSTTNGTPVQQWTCYQGANQTWSANIQ